MGFWDFTLSPSAVALIVSFLKRESFKSTLFSMHEFFAIFNLLVKSFTRMLQADFYRKI